MDVIRPLAEITLADIDQVGAKAAHLGAMLRAGFGVPEGFVIGVEAFVDHFGATTEALVKPPPPRLQSEFMASIVAAVTDHLGNEPVFAVRSSSTSEDTMEASFAGQHATYYFVPPSQIDQAILDCWMSLWSDAAIAYRRAAALEIASSEPVRMAIIVQKMVPATRSGVAFSRDPIDPKNTDCVIEATWGLGASLVDGRVSPDHIRVDESGTLRSYTVSDKQFLVTANLSNPDGRRLDEVPKHKAMARALSNEEAETIANIASQLEALFEGPQDIEWAYAGDELNILQSRPITGLAAPPNEPDRPLVIFKPLAENFTEPLTPMSCDLYASVLPRFGKIVGGRFYLDMDQIRKVVPYQISDEELVDLALLRRTPDRPQLDRSKVIKLAAATTLLSLVDGATWLRASWLNETGLAKYEALANSLRDDPTYDAKKAFRRMFLGRHGFEPLGLHMVIVNVTAGRYFLYLGLLRTLLRRYAPDFSEEQLNKTFHGHQQMHSVDLVRELNQLADTLASARENHDEATAQIEAVIRGEQSLLPAGNEFTIALEQFLARFGHRCSREMELAAPRWSESVAPLLAMVAQPLREQPDRHGAHLDDRHGAHLDDRHGAHLAAMDALHEHLNGWKRWVADHLIRQISKYTALRENTRHYHIMAFALTRQKLLDIEQQLLFTDRLKVAGDVFFLRYAELSDLADGKMDSQEAHMRIRRRRREWARAARVPAPEVLNISLPEVQSNDSATLMGQCACPGQAEGIARVALTLQEATALEPDEILVAPYTDPAWTPLFARAKGIIVGMGSYLSHAGTVARELHVPCIVDVANCTDLIASGQRIRLDAGAGKIEVLE